MTIHDLQQHLAHTEGRIGLAKEFILSDGTSVSVQASATHNCTPGENLVDGAYWEVEVAIHNVLPEEFPLPSVILHPDNGDKIYIWNYLSIVAVMHYFNRVGLVGCYDG